MIRSLFSLACPGGARARLSVLIFHRVTPTVDDIFPGEVDAARFEDICGWVAQWFNVLPLAAAVRRLREGDLPERTLAITFDDGYADNLTVAAPILARHGLASTFFIATGFLDGGCMWNDAIIEAVRRSPRGGVDLSDVGPVRRRFEWSSPAQRRDAIEQLIGGAKYMPVDERAAFVAEVVRRAEVVLPTDLMLTSHQVRELRAQGFDIGGHTVSHPILARLERDDARREIEGGKAHLERIIGEPLALFAYPNGKPGTDYGPQAVALARDAGFEAAVSTGWGVSDARTDPYQLARFTPWDRSRSAFGLRMLRNAFSLAQPAS